MTDSKTIIKTKGDCKGKIAKPNRNIKPFVHVNNEIKVLWEIDGNIDINKKVFGGYIKSNVVVSSEENWIEMLEKVKTYIDANNYTPKKDSKDKIAKILGNWIGTQKNIYNLNKMIKTSVMETIYK